MAIPKYTQEGIDEYEDYRRERAEARDKMPRCALCGEVIWPGKPGSREEDGTWQHKFCREDSEEEEPADDLPSEDSR